MRVLFRNAQLIDKDRNETGSILVHDGVIDEIFTDIDSINVIYDHCIDLEGYALMPSFIDMHCHLREPGYEYKEDIASGMTAALKGGFTTLVAMANTKPVIDDVWLLNENLDKAEELDLCDLIQVSAITKKFGTEPVDFGAIREYTNVFSNDGKPVTDDDTMTMAIRKSEEYDFILCTHSEPETENVKRDMELLRKLKQGHIHVCHISKKDTLDAIKDAKKEGLPVTCEVTAHHLFASGLDYRVHPPFRTEEDRLALIEGVKNGDIDVCGTDHAPHSAEDKKNGAPGLTAFDIAFSLYWKVFSDNGIPIERLSEMLSGKPAEILGIETGILEDGYPADFIIVDLEKEVTVDKKNFLSKSSNTPFDGMKVKGEIIQTYRKGVKKYDNGSVIFPMPC
jgi:dihydroorotase